MEYIVRVKYQNTTKFVVLSENELEWQKFVDKGNSISHKRFLLGDLEKYFTWFNVSGLSVFGTKISERSSVYLSDNIGTDIPRNVFVQIIKNYCHGSNFYVEIKHTPNNNDELVTPKVFYFLARFSLIKPYFFTFPAN